MSSYKESSYYQTIESVCNRYPDLISFRDFLRKHQTPRAPRHSHGRATVLELRAGGVVREDFRNNVNKLEEYFESTRKSTCKHRLYLLEDLSPEYVEAFGSHFWMDPCFFAAQEAIVHWTGTKHDNGFPQKLPSVRRPDPFYTLRYYETIKLAQRPPRKASIRVWSNLYQRIERAKLDFPENEEDKIYMVRRNASFWSRPTREGGWDGLMLVEPPVGNDVLIRFNKPWSPEHYPSKPYQKGYVDFSTWNRLSASSLPHKIVRGPPRTSIFDDIAYYWVEVASGDQITAAQNNPALSAVYLQKLVASN